VPGFRVSAVIEEPYGCHPFELVGYRGLDTAMFSLINQAFKAEDGLKNYFDEWVYGLPDRAAYMKHYVKIFGQQMLNNYQARSYHSAPANYGIPFQSGWDHNGISHDLGVDREGLEQLIEKKGELVDVK
jgi:glutaconate CoA-transferase subunit A